MRLLCVISRFLTLSIVTLTPFLAISIEAEVEHSCINETDLPNFKIVNDTLIRGGQPTREGYLCLQKMGVRTVINVRGNDEDELLHGLSFNYAKRRMKSRSPSIDQAVWFLKHATEVENAPVFLHCAEGSHRTGWLVAIYRIFVEGWSRENAIKEMTAEGTGFNNKYPNLVEFVRTADMLSLKKALVSK